MPPEGRIVSKEGKPVDRSGSKTAATAMALERERSEQALPKGVRIIALDEHGKDFTTTQFSARVRIWLDSGVATAFLIGGPDGLDAALKRECELLLRLSSFTLPHALARAVFAEQLYPPAFPLGGHPYPRK